MHTEPETSIFFFAHQDDEFGVFQLIANAKIKGHRVLCVYLTTGVPNGGLSETRNGESRFVLKNFFVDEVIFGGDVLSIPDGSLNSHLEKAYTWVDNLLSQRRNVAGIYVPAWEGGHPDHDSLHAVAVCSASSKGLQSKVWQFPLYNGFRCVWKFFRVLSPIGLNGAIEHVPIKPLNRLRFLRLVLLYPSQRKTWVGLLPFVFSHYLIRGSQSVQPVSKFRIAQRPHPGILYYEKRRFSTWEIVSENVFQLPF